MWCMSTSTLWTCHGKRANPINRGKPFLIHLRMIMWLNGWLLVIVLLRFEWLCGYIYIYIINAESMLAEPDMPQKSRDRQDGSGWYDVCSAFLSSLIANCDALQKQHLRGKAFAPGRSSWWYLSSKERVQHSLHVSGGIPYPGIAAQ